jgi:hypothetical protein
MSFVAIQPEALITTATNLTSAGSALSAQNMAAAAPITALIPAAADQVSAMTAAQFAAHAHSYQVVSAQAAAIHDQFVTMLTSSAHSYADVEAVNANAAGRGGL